MSLAGNRFAAAGSIRPSRGPIGHSPGDTEISDGAGEPQELFPEWHCLNLLNRSILVCARRKAAGVFIQRNNLRLAYLSQFSTFSTGTRLNSETLSVTQVASIARACAAINMSWALIGVPLFSSAMRIEA